MPTTGVRIVDTILTTLARGYKPVGNVGDKLFPVKIADKEGGKIPIFGKEAFRHYDTRRALLADSNIGNNEAVTTVTYEMEEHDLALRIDQREKAQAAYNVESHRVKNAMAAISLGYEYECATTATTAANYPTDNKVTMTDDYLNEAAIDPVNYLKDKMKIVRQIIGTYPNTIIMGGKVWEQLWNHPKISAYLRSTDLKAYGPAVLRELLATGLTEQKLDVHIGLGTYVPEGETTPTEIWGNYIAMGYVSTAENDINSNIFEPSFGVTLRGKGYPISDKYTDNGNKISYVRTTDLYSIKVIMPDAGYLITHPIDPDVYSPA